MSQDPPHPEEPGTQTQIPTLPELDGQPYKFDAFISYRHEGLDEKEAGWLQDALESYRVPADPVPKKGPPRRLKVCRDKTDMRARSDLTQEIKDKLKESRYLVVVCSPRTPESEYVGKEIEYFRSLGRANHILALLIDGEPATSFPTALGEPLAADIRSNQQGRVTASARQTALLQILAGTIPCDFDALQQREKNRQARARRRRVAVLACLAVVLGGLTGLAVYWWLEAGRQQVIVDKVTKDVEHRAYLLNARKLAAAHAERNFPLMLELLDQMRPQPGRHDFRSFEWYYFRNLAERRAGAELAWPLASVALGPRDGLIAGRDDEGNLWVHDPARRQTRKLPDETWVLTRGQVFSPDGRTLAAGVDHRVQLFALPSLEKRATVQTGEDFPIADVAYSPEGKWLVARNAQGHVKIWDAATAEAVGRADAEPDSTWQFAAGDRALLSRGAGVDLLELPSGKVLRSWHEPDRRLSSFRFSPDGKSLALEWRGAAGATVPATVVIRATTSGAEQARFVSRDDNLSFLSFSPRGHFVVLVGGEGEKTVTRVCAAVGGKECFTLKYGSRPVTVAISPDEKLLASPLSQPGEKEQQDTVLVRELPSGRSLFAVPVAQPEGVAFSPDGQWLACHGEEGLALWDLSTRKPLPGHARPPRQPPEPRAPPDGGAVPLPPPAELFRFSPDGRWVVGGWPGRLVCWFVGEPLPCREVTEPNALAAVAVTGDDQVLACAGNEWHQETRAEIRLWDLAAGTERGLLLGHKGRVAALAFAADGTTLTSASHDFPLEGKPVVQLRRWYVLKQTEQSPGKEFPERAWSLALAPDGRRLALGLGSGLPDDTATDVRVLDLTGKRGPVSLPAGKRWVETVAYSADGELLAAGSAEGGADRQTGLITVWRTAGPGAAVTLRGHAGAVTALAFAADGGTLVSGSADGTVKLWDLAANKEAATFAGHEKEICAVAVAPGQRLAASSSRDGTVKLWDLSARRERTTLRGPTREALTSVQFSPDGRVLAAGGLEGGVTCWDVRTGRQLAHFVGHTSWVQSLAFSPDGKLLASGSGTLRGPRGLFGNGHLSGTLTLRNLPQGTVRLRRTIPAEGINVLAAAPQGRLLAFGTGDVQQQTGHIRLWDPETGKDTCLRGHRDGIQALAFSADGKTLVSGSVDRQVILWDAATGRKKLVLDQGAPVAAVALSPDGKLLAAAGGGGGQPDKAPLVLWDVTTGTKLPLPGHEEGVEALAFSGDGTRLAAAGRDGTIHLQPLNTAEASRALKGHAGAVRSLAFCPDGKTLASGSADRTVKLWDLATGQERLTLSDPAAAVTTVRFCNGGRSLIAGDQNGSVWIWSGLSER
jgi:WD40 repeat protein